MDPAEPEDQISKGERFAFGENWQRFLGGLTEEKISSAEETFTQFVGAENVARMQGRKFLDVGSGSGLSSLVAHRLGATVYSFDYDAQSVACTQTVRAQYASEQGNWEVAQGSILDDQYVASLGVFDWVYSWGVLHHTGQLDKALANAARLVAPQGHAYIAIYNDQGWISQYWTRVKKLYNRGPLGRGLMIAIHFPYLFVLRWIVRALTARLQHERGMSLWWDMRDWLGGYPFEVARPGDLIERFAEYGFELVNLKDCGRRQGCNEFLFKRT